MFVGACNNGATCVRYGDDDDEFYCCCPPGKNLLYCVTCSFYHIYAWMHVGGTVDMALHSRSKGLEFISHC